MISGGGSETKELIRRSLADALEAAGFQVVEKSDLVVKAICKQQPAQTVSINADGRWPVRPQVARLYFWRAGRSAYPGMPS